jgi:hypothetical protein
VSRVGVGAGYGVFQPGAASAPRAEEGAAASGSRLGSAGTLLLSCAAVPPRTLASRRRCGTRAATNEEDGLSAPPRALLAAATFLLLCALAVETVPGALAHACSCLKNEGISDNASGEGPGPSARTQRTAAQLQGTPQSAPHTPAAAARPSPPPGHSAPRMHPATLPACHLHGTVTPSVSHIPRIAIASCAWLPLGTTSRAVSHLPNSDSRSDAARGASPLCMCVR